MGQYHNIPDKFIRVLAKKKDFTFKRGTSIPLIIKALEDANHAAELEYLDSQFRFATEMSALTICKPSSDFPDGSKTPEKFRDFIVEHARIQSTQWGTEWDPPLRTGIQLAGIVQDGSDVYLRMVEEKTQSRREDYSRRVSYKYADVSFAVIHFADEVIELRCAYSYRDKYMDFILQLLGFGEPYHWFPISRCTKEDATKLSAYLSAGLASTQVQIPSTVGSMRFNASKGVNLRFDPTYTLITEAIANLGLPTDDTMDETCVFTFNDPVIGIEIPVSFEINLKNGGFKFNSDVTEAVIDRVLDAFIQVCYVQKQQELSEVGQ